MPSDLSHKSSGLPQPEGMAEMRMGILVWLPIRRLVLDLPARLLTSHGLIFALNLAEEAVHFITDAGGEEELVGFACGETIAELQGPQVIDLDCNTPGIFERTEGLARIRIESIDAAVPEIADQQGIAKLAEIGGCKSQTPGRVEPAA